MRTHVELDDALVEEAFRMTGLRTKRALLQLALEELIRTKKKKNLLDLAGKITFADDFDYKAMRDVRNSDH